MADGLPAGDFKSMNKSAKYLFDCGHIQKIEVVPRPQLEQIVCPK